MNGSHRKLPIECAVVPRWEGGSQHVTTCLGLIKRSKHLSERAGKGDSGNLKVDILHSDQKLILPVGGYQNHQKYKDYAVSKC